MDHEVFDRLVDQAWPAPHRVTAGGWTYRHAGGVTKRANSVLPLGPREDLAAAVDEAEKFYAGLGLACVFSVGGGATPGLDGVLESRGYRVVDPTLVMTASLADLAPEGSVRDGEIAERPSEEWMATWWGVDGGRHPAGSEVWGERILTGVRAGYARVGGAVGRAVPQGDWIGIYCMAVEPAARRRGLGTAIMRVLLGWGRTQGAVRAYLVVTSANEGARALYERAGFSVAGRYHYRVRP